MTDFDWAFDGLTKREWFAGMAMSGMLSNPEHVNEASVHDTAKDARVYADKLIAELERTKES